MNRRTFLRIAGTGAALSLGPFAHLSMAQTVAVDRLLPRATPESQGIASRAILAFLDEADEQFHALHSLMIARHGSVVAEGWWAPYRSDLNHWLFSVSKGFTSAGVGLAISEGRFSLDDSVISFFPDAAPADPSANLKAMTVRDLLRMNQGHQGSGDREVMRADNAEWTRTWLAREVEHAPGTHWAYSNSAAYVLSAVVQRVTGERLIDYLRPRLLEPLGIVNPVWDESPEGVSLGGSGLRVRTEDILKFGQLHLQRGRWEGREILSESWVTEATSVQAKPPEGDTIKAIGYHLLVDPERESFGSGGRFGQTLIISPRTESVIAITAGVRPNRTRAVQELVWKHLDPAMGETPLPEDVDARAALMTRLGCLSLPTVGGRKISAVHASIDVSFEPNDRGITAAALAPTESGMQLTLTARKIAHKIHVGYAEWTAGHTAFEPPALDTLGMTHDGSPVPCAACGAWTDDRTFEARLCYTESPFIEKMTFGFESARVTFDQIPNLRMKRWTPRKRERLVGVRT